MKNLGFAPLKCLCLSRTPMFLVPPMVSYLYCLLGCIHHRSHKLLLKLHIIVGHKHNCTSSLIFFFLHYTESDTESTYSDEDLVQVCIFLNMYFYIFNKNYSIHYSLSLEIFICFGFFYSQLSKYTTIQKFEVITAMFFYAARMH